MQCDPMNSHHHKLQRNLVCVEYPAIVRNPDRLIASLGGAKELSTTICLEKRRLELCFRPESMYSKPVFGDRHTTTGIVLKVKIRRKRSQPNEVQVKSMEIAGTVKLVYRFESMCDFQLLPVYRNKEGTMKCMYNQLVPSGVITTNIIDESSDVPFFLPPVSFSRFDTAQLSIFKFKDSGSEILEKHGKMRARRSQYGIYTSFSLVETLPTEPNDLSTKNIKNRKISPETVERVKQIFQERPIWTKAALKSSGQLSEDEIRYILPTLAYYFINGPWRGTWVRFGYDPRKFFESRFYQLLDFRVRAIGALHDKVLVKRSQNPSKPCMRFSNPAVNARRDNSEPSIAKAIAPENAYIFTMDTLPRMRIIFYQYCDVHVPQIQQMLEKIPTPVTGAVCNEKNGWLPPRFDEHCRDILTEIVLSNFQKQKKLNLNVSEPDEAEGDETEATFDEDDFEQSVEELQDDEPTMSDEEEQS